MELFLKQLWDDLRIYMERWKGLSQGGFLTALFCQGRVVWSGTLRMIQASYRRLYFKTCIFRLIAEAYKDFTIKNKQWIRSFPVLSFLVGCSFLRSTLVVRPFVSGTGEAETGEHMVGHLPGQRELVGGEIHHAISAGLSASQLQKVTENTGASKRRFCATMTAFRAVKMARIGQVYFSERRACPVWFHGQIIRTGQGLWFRIPSQGPSLRSRIGKRNLECTGWDVGPLQTAVEIRELVHVDLLNMSEEMHRDRQFLLIDDII